MAGSSYTLAKPDPDAIVNETKLLLKEMSDMGDVANQYYADHGDVDGKLNSILAADVAASNKNFSEVMDAFEAASDKATHKAQKILNITDADKAANASTLLVNAEIALDEMNYANEDLKRIQEGTRKSVHSDVKALIKAEKKVVKDFKHNVSSLQHKARATMDPLYGLGDAAEDKADVLNDEISDASSDARKAIKHASEQFLKNAKGQAKEVEKGLKNLVRDSENDRKKTAKATNTLVQEASEHLDSLLDDDETPEQVLAVLPAGAVNAFAAGASAMLSLLAVVFFMLRFARTRRAGTIEQPLLLE
eukprot:TRINITY_DN71875_c0_g1_i1.p1 TRINITY_DN71875_c0_g1~~TRINITY_DN71875_c0_g1_i1.p1  ORF type:complete len:335 (-),score=78.07 TRINITY_DN71875_c0_g1_i1:225-1142(-)